MNRYRLTGAASLLLLVAFPAPAAEAQESGAFITRLGADTLAVERFRHTPQRFEAEVVIRTPETRIRSYILDRSDSGDFARLEAVTRTPDGQSVQKEVATLLDGNLVVETERGGGSQRREMAAHGGVLPFIDMVHWPFELMLRSAYAGGADSVVQDLYSGRRTMPFVVRRHSDDSMTVQHPFRGTMGVTVDDAGRLVLLDAGATTRKLRVQRVESVDLDAIANRFAALDRAGRSFGALSGRGAAEAVVHGATITVDYGTPAKRGRRIFGDLVPYGERWRTGANRATHFTTDRDLRFGELHVPAGTYTLSTLPGETESILIINRQTGQGGTSYDPSQDLGRVALTHAALDEAVEIFTIAVEETPSGGALKLRWDRTELGVEFTVE